MTIDRSVSTLFDAARDRRMEDLVAACLREIGERGAPLGHPSGIGRSITISVTADAEPEDVDMDDWHFVEHGALTAIHRDTVEHDDGRRVFRFDVEWNPAP